MRGREGVQKVDYISLWQLNRERTSRGRAAKEAGGRGKMKKWEGGEEERRKYWQGEAHSQ